MAKQKSIYSCQSCGYNSSKWLGRCPTCGEWSSFVEEAPSSETGSAVSISDIREEFRALGERRAAVRQDEDTGLAGPRSRSGKSWEVLGELSADQEKETEQDQRISTGISELDRVLGGGLVPDSFVLLGGDPGIGKSTLLLQMAEGISRVVAKGAKGAKDSSGNGSRKILYVSGEESIQQIRNRARRLDVSGSGRILLAAETQLEKVLGLVKELDPQVVILDSLQTFSTHFANSAPGSVGQVREIAARLMTLAKSANVAVFLVGHVTKEGSIAGPKTVEHMVDTVLYFEGEASQNYRLLRTVKNRFGSTRELGVFEMEGEGLKEVTNPSSLFLSERKSAVSGTAVAVPLEGSRPLLVEVQALVTSSGLGMPRRTAVGMDAVRVSILSAILEKHLELSLAGYDLYFNVSGGLKLSEPACDLAAAVAIWSSFRNIALPMNWVFVGEMGLTGEVRAVTQIESRLEEARRLGFRVALIPKSTPKAVIEKLQRTPDLQVKLIGWIGELERLVEEGA